MGKQLAMPPKSKVRVSVIVVRILICVVLLALGAMGMVRLKAMKKAPTQSVPGERAIRVAVATMSPAQVPVHISGFGQVNSLNTAQIAPEVAGRVVSVHERLETGETVKAGEVLVQLDDRDYKASLIEARAAVAQLENVLERLRQQQSLDQSRLVGLERNQQLAEADFERLKKLFEVDQVGTRSGVEAGERAVIGVADQVALMAQTVALYPLRIAETRQNLKGAGARAQMAAIRMERTTIRAPFDGRLAMVNVERGAYLSPGKIILSLADDSTLEVVVPIDSRDARQWLQFNPRPDHNLAWFDRLKTVDCKIQWTEATPDQYWTGRLHRVVKFDQQTRTVHVAIRVGADQIKNPSAPGLPLVEGMFCRVSIPGRLLTDVFEIPRWAVTYDNNVYLAVADRLKTVNVKVAKIQGDQAIISHGLKDGDQVIITRLVDPLENALLAVGESSS